MVNFKYREMYERKIKFLQKTYKSGNGFYILSNRYELGTIGDQFFDFISTSFVRLSSI